MTSVLHWIQDLLSHTSPWVIVLGVLLFLSGPAPAKPFDFAHDVAPVLAKAGCSAAECHGGAAGKGGFRITLEHILPNIVSVLVVQATIQFAIAILAEAALSYLGIGSQPPTPSWGRMLSEAQTLIFLNPWLAVYPGVAIALSVLGLNLLGDGLRDIVDPRLARQR